MNKEEAIEQLNSLICAWEYPDREKGNIINQTDINAIGVIMNELELANDKLECINKLINTKREDYALRRFNNENINYEEELFSYDEDIFSIIDGGNDERETNTGTNNNAD